MKQESIKHVVSHSRAQQMDVDNLLDYQQAVKEIVKSNEYGFADIQAHKTMLEEIKPYISDYQKRFKQVYVIGTGGSSLGSKTLINALQHRINKHENYPTVDFLENVDPQTILNVMDQIDLKHTGFVVISKSGSTPETVALYHLMQDLYLKDERVLKDHFLMISDPKPSVLRDIAQANDISILDHASHVGGRFSVFTNVGLLPAAIAGIDVEQILNGAEVYLQHFIQDCDANAVSAATTGAEFQVAHYRDQAASMAVMMPYCDGLYHFCYWFRQIWAESLGKDGIGSTPVNAMGAVDQHSQVQLYLGGPNDKTYTILSAQDLVTDPRLSLAAVNDEKLNYLKGHQLGDVFQAMQESTVETLCQNDRPTREIQLKELNERALGQLLMHFMLETVLASKMLNINAFDQPAVEQGKILTRQKLNGSIKQG